MKENLKKRAEQEKNMKNCLKTLNFNMALMGHHTGDMVVLVQTRHPKHGRCRKKGETSLSCEKGRKE